MKLFTGTTPGIVIVNGCLPVGSKQVPVAAALCAGQGGKESTHEVSLHSADLDMAGLALVEPKVAKEGGEALLLIRESVVGLNVINFEPHDLVPSCSRCKVALFDASAQSYSVAYSPAWCVLSAMDALVVLEPGAWVELHTEECSAVSWLDLLLCALGLKQASTVKVHRARWTYDGTAVVREQMPSFERAVQAS